jgi:hypothetical protein
MKMPVIRGEGPFALILLPSVNYIFNLYIKKIILAWISYLDIWASERI